MELDTPQKYARDLSACQTLEALRACVGAYAELAKDALPIVNAMTDADFPVFVKGLKSERRGKFAGEEWARRFIAVLMPEPMFTVAKIADQYKVPFIVALRRITEVRPDLIEFTQPGAAGQEFEK